MPTTNGPRESAVLSEVVKYLALRGDTFTWRHNTGAVQLPSGGMLRFGLVGSADLIGVIAPSGRLLAIETKRARGGVLTDEQRKFGERIVEAGGLYIVARSAADVEAALPPVTVRLSPEIRRVIPR